jgi:hypothetical protein
MCLKEFCEKKEILDYQRFRWFFWILFFSLLSFIVFYLYQDNFFYDKAKEGIKDVYRFLWILPFSFMGFSFLALMVAKNSKVKNDKPWISYIFSYFPRLIAFSLIIFSVLHLFYATSGYIYYFFSAGLGLYLGYHIDAIKLEELANRAR